MGIFDFGSSKPKPKPKRSVKTRILRGVARARRAAKPLVGGYAPVAGPERTLAGYKLRGKQLKHVRKVRAKAIRGHKRVARRIWRRLV